MKLKLAIFAVFLSMPTWADDLYTTTINNGCGDAYYYRAVLRANTYTCNSGYYLPAGAISCVQCPSGYTCNGGTFTFNANETQGLSEGDILLTNAIGSCSNEFSQNLSALFIVNQYTCGAGTYLPAGNDWINDVEGCRTCPANSYCAGGTYIFNETTAQGVTPCPNNQTSLPGASSVNQCKTYTINWISNDETYTTSTCTINDTITLPVVEPTRPGYTFAGWKLESK